MHSLKPSFIEPASSQKVLINISNFVEVSKFKFCEYYYNHPILVRRIFLDYHKVAYHQIFFLQSLR